MVVGFEHPPLLLQVKDRRSVLRVLRERDRELWPSLHYFSTGQFQTGEQAARVKQTQSNQSHDWM